MSMFKTSFEYVLFTVLDNKLIKKIAKQYEKQVDKLYNEEEEIKSRKTKVKIGKEFLIPNADKEDLSKELDIKQYLNNNLKYLKEEGLESFLRLHGWTKEKLFQYYTDNNSCISPITSISFN